MHYDYINNTKNTKTKGKTAHGQGGKHTMCCKNQCKMTQIQQKHHGHLKAVGQLPESVCHDIHGVRKPTATLYPIHDIPRKMIGFPMNSPWSIFIKTQFRSCLLPCKTVVVLRFNREPGGGANFRQASLFAESIQNRELIFRDYLWDIERYLGVQAPGLVHGYPEMNGISRLIEELYGWSME